MQVAHRRQRAWAWHFTGSAPGGAGGGKAPRARLRPSSRHAASAGVAGNCVDGLGSLCGALRISVAVAREQVAAAGVARGMTQSNRSPQATPCTRSSGVPTPMGSAALCAGAVGVCAMMRSMSSLGSPTLTLHHGVASKVHRHQLRQRLLTHSDSNMPPCTMPNKALALPAAQTPPAQWRVPARLSAMDARACAR